MREETRGSLIFWGWSYCSVVGCDSYHRIYIKAVVGWGAVMTMNFHSFVSEANERNGFFWYNGLVNRETNSVINGRVELRRSGDIPVATNGVERFFSCLFESRATTGRFR